MYPKIVGVKPEDEFVLIIEFDNKISKRVDMTEKIREARFNLLRDKAFFATVKVDAGGYGISWNDEIDMSEYELWESGEVYNYH